MVHSTLQPVTNPVLTLALSQMFFEKIFDSFFTQIPIDIQHITLDLRTVNGSEKIFARRVLTECALTYAPEGL